MRTAAEARAQTDRLFALVDPAALYDRPIPERHRIVFYLGHLEAFDWNLLRGDRDPFHPEFDQLFAFGIDPVGGGLPDDKPSDWPGVAEILDYNRRVRQELDQIAPSDLLLNVAIEHRLMHAETLAYMLHQLPLEKKAAVGPDPEIAAPPVRSEMIEIPAGDVTLGLRRESGVFGWDNEFEQRTVHVPSFRIDPHKVSNGDYLRFVNEGGNPPVFWKKQPGSGRWTYRTMFAELPLPLDWPVYVSHADAAAYAKWAGKSLPTEAEWQRAADATPIEGNFDFKRWDPVPVSANGEAGFWGNGWEWTSSLFEPFPGFEPFPFYPGYSANFFDGRHYVMKGGSPRTARCMMRRSFRNWFQPNYPYVYAGFRCVTR